MELVGEPYMKKPYLTCYFARFTEEEPFETTDVPHIRIITKVALLMLLLLICVSSKGKAATPQRRKQCSRRRRHKSIQTPYFVKNIKVIIFYVILLMFATGFVTVIRLQKSICSTNSLQIKN